jgi:hypothetical protein
MQLRAANLPHVGNFRICDEPEVGAGDALLRRHWPRHKMAVGDGLEESRAKTGAPP